VLGPRWRASSKRDVPHRFMILGGFFKDSQRPPISMRFAYGYFSSWIALAMQFMLLSTASLLPSLLIKGCDESKMTLTLTLPNRSNSPRVRGTK
jgi:hypothetical protein